MADNATESENTTESENHAKIDAKLIEDTVHLQQIFPEEIWERVFDNLKDPVSLINLGNASPLFKRLLLPRRTEYLFPTVWNILAVHLHNEEESERGNSNLARHIPTPRIVDTELYSGVLAARVVCHTWKIAIDKFILFHALPETYAEKTGIACASHLVDSHWLSDAFRTDPLLLDKFLQHFKATHEDSKCEFSPFLTRRIDISYVPVCSIQYGQYPVNDKVTQVLQTYGRHLLVFEIRMEYCSVTRNTFATIRQWLTLVPNLISLTILYYGEVVDDVSLDMNFVARRQRLPKLNKLRHLQFVRCSSPLVRFFRQTYQRVAYFSKD